MADYSDEIADALELIQEFGVQCEWRKGDLTPDDPHRPWLGGNDESDEPFTPYIVFLPATNTNTSFGLTKLSSDSTNFSTYGLMGVQEFEPQVTDLLTRDGRALVVVSVDTLAPAGEPVLYVLGIQ